MAALLSKIDVNLRQFDFVAESGQKNVVDLYLGDGPKVKGDTRTNNNNNNDNTDNDGSRTPGISINESVYAGTVQSNNEEHICYHLSHENDMITLYQLAGNITAVPTVVNIHLSTKLLNQQHTMSVYTTEDTLLINMILEDSVYISVSLPLLLFNSNEDIDVGDDWFKAYAPYDFSIRVPHLLHTISPQLTMVFLKDGGLLGLRTLENNYVEPILFNDSSYLQNLVSMFKLSRGNKQQQGKVVSCVVFQDRYLITLTEFCYLKIWDITTFNLVQEYDLSNDEFESSKRTFNIIGNYLTIYHNFLSVYTPYHNGVFQIGTLLVDNSQILQFNSQTKVPSNLSSSSIWFLADMRLIRPIDLGLSSTYINLITLWKSGNLSKVQLLNISDENLAEYEWIETVNKSINDINSEYDLIIEDNKLETNDYEKLLFKLKSRYAPEIFQRAERILSENNIVVVNDSSNLKQNLEYLGNLETVLKDLKIQCDEVSTLSICKDELIFVNTLKKYNHSVYKVNDKIENMFYNIKADSKDQTTELIIFFKSLDVFASNLSNGVLLSCSRNFISLITGEISSELTLGEKFSKIFKISLQGQFDISQLQIMFNQLNSIDVVSALNNFIDIHLNSAIPSYRQSFVEAITSSQSSKILSIESIYQRIAIEHHFVLEVLLTFVLLDTNYSVFESQLTKLLELFYKQSMFLRLFQQDKALLTNLVFKATTSLGYGPQLQSYEEWNSYIHTSVNKIYSFDIDSNPFFYRFFDEYVICNPLSADSDGMNSFLFNLAEVFCIRGNKVQEFLQAMLLFVAGKFEESFNLFEKYDDYVDIPINSLPPFLISIIDDENNQSIWSDLIRTLKSIDNKNARFNYYLSCLFNKYGNSPELALRAIKKSIQISMLNDNSDEFELATLQHIQLLNLSIFFSLYDEVLNILRLSHFCLPLQLRTEYFETLLASPNTNDVFFSKLLEFCNKAVNNDNNPGDRLSHEDYETIDTILVKNLTSGQWKDFKRLYSYRLLNKNEREAAEVVYQYYIRYGNSEDIESQKNYYLIIINILSTFDTVYEQWLLNGKEVVTLSDLQSDFNNL